MESSQDFDGTRDFAEESLNEEIKEELIDTVFDITGNEVNSSEVLQKLEELNDEEKALEQIDNIDDYEKEYIGEELKNKLFEDLIDSSIAPVSESGKIDIMNIEEGILETKTDCSAKDLLFVASFAF